MNTSGRLLLKNFVLNSLILLIDYLIRRMFIHDKGIISGSRTIAPEENYPPTLNLILTLTETLTLTGGGAIFLGEELPGHHHFRSLYQKYCARNFKFYEVRKINLQCSVISRHRIKHLQWQ